MSSSQSESILWGGVLENEQGRTMRIAGVGGGEVRFKTRESSANTLFEYPHTRIAQYLTK